MDSAETTANQGLTDHAHSAADRIRALGADAEAGGAAFQSVVVAVVQTLNRVLHHERLIASASVSLAQREQVRGMTSDVEALIRALREMLSTQGTQVLNECVAHTDALPDDESLWYALNEALQATQEAIDGMGGLVAAQPKGSATRTLIGIVVRLLRNHHNQLLAELDAWVN